MPRAVKKPLLDPQSLSPQALLARNRRYLTLARSRPHDLKPPVSHDPAYQVLILALQRVTYQPTQIPELISMLGEEDVMQVYRAMVGLSSFGEAVVTRASEEGFLGSGVVPSLVQLALWRDHPFLQQRSLELLKHIAKSVSQDHLRAFCNLATIPFSLFTAALRFSPHNFAHAVQLLHSLNERAKYVDPCDDNADLLADFEHILGLVPEDGSQLQHLKCLCRMLNEIRFHFWTGRRRFANRYFAIRRRVLQIYREKQSLEGISNEIRVVYDKDKLKAICSAIEEYPQEVAEVHAHFADLIDLCFTLKFPRKASLLVYFINVLVDLKNASPILPREDLFERTESLLLGEPLDQTSRSLETSEGCISILWHIMLSCSDALLEVVLSRGPLLQRLASLYRCWENRVVAELNSIVRLLVKRIGKPEVREVLEEYALVDLYFQNSCRFSQMLAKGALKYMMWTLNTLQKEHHNAYLTARATVASDTNYAIVRKIRAGSSLSRMEDIFHFYDNLRVEEAALNEPPSPLRAVMTAQPVTSHSLTPINHTDSHQSSPSASLFALEAEQDILEVEDAPEVLEVDEAPEVIVLDDSEPHFVRHAENNYVVGFDGVIHIL